MTDLHTFLMMLASSKEIYEVASLGEGRRVNFAVRGISFYFDKEGNFDRIVKL
jgi:hypothetical protein